MLTMVSHVEYADGDETDRQTDERQTVASCSPLDANSVIKSSLKIPSYLKHVVILLYDSFKTFLVTESISPVF